MSLTFAVRALAGQKIYRVLSLSLALASCRPAPSVPTGPSSTGPAPEAGKSCAAGTETSHPVRGAIFAAECGPTINGPNAYAGDAVVGYWQPTPALVETLEARLRPALELGRKNPESVVKLPAGKDIRDEVSSATSGAIGEILASYTSYRRQYLGIILRRGGRRVLVNSLPEATPGTADEFADWKERWVDYVDDGGSSFWCIEYDVASGRFLHFEVNATA
jgi:hypothetical protein